MVVAASALKFASYCSARDCPINVPTIHRPLRRDTISYVIAIDTTTSVDTAPNTVTINVATSNNTACNIAPNFDGSL